MECQPVYELRWKTFTPHSWNQTINDDEEIWVCKTKRNEPLERLSQRHFRRASYDNPNMPSISVSERQIWCARCHRHFTSRYPFKVSNFAFSIVDCAPFFHSTSQRYCERNADFYFKNLNIQTQLVSLRAKRLLSSVGMALLAQKFAKEKCSILTFTLKMESKRKIGTH